MKLKKISVTSFKKIAELEIELHALNLVIGANNSGKSSLLQAIHTAVSAAQSQTEVGSTTFAEEILRYSPSSQFASLSHGSSFGNRKNQNRATIKFTADQTVDNINEEIEYTIEMYKGRNERNVGINRSGHQRLGNSISSIENPFSIYVPGLAGIPHFEEFRASPVVLRKLAGGEANLVLRNIIWQITKQEKLGELISNLN